MGRAPAISLALVACACLPVVDLEECYTRADCARGQSCVANACLTVGDGGAIADAASPRDAAACTVASATVTRLYRGTAADLGLGLAPRGASGWALTTVDTHAGRQEILLTLTDLAGVPAAPELTIRRGTADASGGPLALAARGGDLLLAWSLRGGALAGGAYLSVLDAATGALRGPELLLSGRSRTAFATSVAAGASSIGVTWLTDELDRLYLARAELGGTATVAPSLLASRSATGADVTYASERLEYAVVLSTRTSNPEGAQLNFQRTDSAARTTTAAIAGSSGGLFHQSAAIAFAPPTGEYLLAWQQGPTAAPTGVEVGRLARVRPGAPNQRVLAADLPGLGFVAPSLAWAGERGELGLAVERRSTGATAILFYRLAPDLTVIGDALEVAAGPFELRRPRLAWNGATWALAWIDTTAGPGAAVRFATITCPP